MLTLTDLQVAAGEKKIIHNLNLSISPGELHVLMGPNGSGKSTLAMLLAGHPHYTATHGTAFYQQSNLLDYSATIRSQKGLFVAFQNPTAIAGVGNAYFMRQIYNQRRRILGQPEVEADDFLTLMKEKLALIGLDNTFLSRSLNQDFSGGEKKCNEILQMLLLEPDCIILDEIDSGLDSETRKRALQIIKSFRTPKRSFLIITHYPDFIENSTIDKLHIMENGTIVKSTNGHNHGY